MVTYLSNNEQWQDLHARLLDSKRAGLDTEFYDVDFDCQTATHRAMIWLWSIALPTDALTPRGYPVCDSWVLPYQALGVFRPWLESSKHVKYAHNAGAEQHSIYHTSGIWLEGLVDTLSWARWAMPERHPTPGFGLKSLARDLLDREPVGSYESVMSVPRTVMVKKIKCACGVDKCRKRSLPEHTKLTVMEEEVRGVEVLPLQTIHEGHALFPKLIQYSGEDAEFAYQIAELLRDSLRPRILHV